jgi:superfamily II DNA helicase RecQ
MHAIMPYHIFIVPVHDDGSAIVELNGFLRSHKVLSVDRRWVDLGTESFWSFCVDYLERGAGGVQTGKGGGARGKVDYREVLSPEDFAVFARLRQMRKEISQAEAVPVYTVFTNEQLAQMVQTRATTKAALEGIAGVGDARIEKYGARFLDFLCKQWSEAATDEASR